MHQAEWCQITVTLTNNACARASWRPEGRRARGQTHPKGRTRPVVASPVAGGVPHGLVLSTLVSGEFPKASAAELFSPFRMALLGSSAASKLVAHL